ncbi:uncharacterized protein DMAD_05414 [Drosophila madeirensis]|uniref:Uncharacterized protein n=1 Tax=Drosophila madeirensis TaxID=30013 RepID=A0AAU9FMF9_DROMD
MQELTRVCELNHNSIHNKVKTTATPPAISNLEPLLPIKLEHDHDLESWLPTTDHGHLRLDLNTTRLLLQGSDDPWISHGASNDAHDEDHPFKTLLARKTASQEQQQRQQQQHNATCSPLTKQQLKANLLMGNRKTHWPQPAPQLPAPEEPPTLLTQKTPRPATSQSRSKKRTNSAGAMKLRFHHQALPAEYAAHYEATQGRQPPRPVLQPPPQPPPSQAHENVRSWLRKIAEIQRSAERQQQKQASTRKDSPVMRPTPPAGVPPPEKAPEVAAPSKRGALKYADLPYMGELTLDNYKPRRGRKPKKADICHLIYKNYGTIVPTTSAVRLPVSAPLPDTTVHRATPTTLRPEEPLNLCLRDQSSDRYSISSGDSDKPTPTTKATTDCGSSSHRTTPLSAVKPLTLELVGGHDQPLVASKLLLQPVGLYYQQLMESCSLGGLPVPVETIEKDNQLSLKIPIPSGFFSNEAMPLPLALRKRKRSAIFIPPLPAEHSSSPSTEVSICKFKFTGGAKPTLQEKKMLSVDAEGNYRYYNGTGDKTMRGYEFISRDQQQQQQQHQQQQQGQAPGQDKLYVDIPPPSTDLSLELLQIPPVSPTSSLLLSSANSIVPAFAPHSPASSTQSPMPPAVFPSLPPFKPSTGSERKRRSSRRSKQREKLENTFKEKGFLIQTQQLQSAEGATYCKFRQLKKFTRYLFRNWKDHIPESDLVKHQSGVREDDSVIDNLLGLESLASPAT